MPEVPKSLERFAFDEELGFPFTGIPFEEGGEPCLGCSLKIGQDIIVCACVANDETLLNW